MNTPRQFRSAIFITLFFLACGTHMTIAQKMTLREINAIQAKNVLSDKDLETITAYVGGKLAEMLSVHSTEELAMIKRHLNQARYSQSPAAQQVYANRFADAIKANYQRVLNQAAKLPNKKLGANIQLCVVIIVAETDSLELIDELLALLKNESQAIRYWAVKGLTGPTIYQFLMDEDSDSESLQAVLTGLSDCLSNETNAVVISAIAAAASLPVHDDALAIVKACVEKRLESYASWTVDRELEDLAIFRYLLEMVDSDELNDNTDLQSDLVRQAVRLYTAAYYRYSLGRQCDKERSSLSLLKKNSQQRLETFLIEGERLLRLVASRIDNTVRTAPRFLNAVDSQKCSEFNRAYTLLLDSEDGSINRVFDLYPDPEADLYPSLPDPPVELIEMAQTRLHIAANALGITN